MNAIVKGPLLHGKHPAIAQASSDAISFLREGFPSRTEAVQYAEAFLIEQLADG